MEKVKNIKITEGLNYGRIDPHIWLDLDNARKW